MYDSAKPHQKQEQCRCCYLAFFRPCRKCPIKSHRKKWANRQIQIHLEGLRNRTVDFFLTLSADDVPDSHFFKWAYNRFSRKLTKLKNRFKAKGITLESSLVAETNDKGVFHVHGGFTTILDTDELKARIKPLWAAAFNLNIGRKPNRLSSVIRDCLDWCRDTGELELGCGVIVRIDPSCTEREIRDMAFGTKTAWSSRNAKREYVPADEYWSPDAARDPFIKTRVHVSTVRDKEAVIRYLFKADTVANDVPSKFRWVRTSYGFLNDRKKNIWARLIERWFGPQGSSTYRDCLNWCVETGSEMGGGVVKVVQKLAGVVDDAIGYICGTQGRTPVFPMDYAGGDDLPVRLRVKAMDGLGVFKDVMNWSRAARVRAGHSCHHGYALFESCPKCGRLIGGDKPEYEPVEYRDNEPILIGEPVETVATSLSALTVPCLSSRLPSNGSKTCPG